MRAVSFLYNGKRQCVILREGVCNHLFTETRSLPGHSSMDFNSSLFDDIIRNHAGCFTVLFVLHGI